MTRCPHDKVNRMFHGVDEDVRLFVQHKPFINELWVKEEEERLSSWIRKEEAAPELCGREDSGACDLAVNMDRLSECETWEITLTAKSPKEQIPVKSWEMVNCCCFECLVVFLLLDARHWAFYNL